MKNARFIYCYRRCRKVCDGLIGNVTGCMIHSMIDGLITRVEVIDAETVLQKPHQIYRI